MPGGQYKKKFKLSGNSEISPKLGKHDRRRTLDKVRHIKQRHVLQSRGEGGSDELELSESRPGEQ